jgi:Bifunctional DNA primase/polymerase, N-terminal.
MSHDHLRRAAMSRNPFLAAALTAAARGWAVFPLVPGEKIPAIRDWEQRATTDQQQIHRWWARGARNNIAVATGRSGLVVIDLDGAHGDVAPGRFAGARNGYDALAMRAAETGADMPMNTFTVATPGGRHLYYLAPSGVHLRNSAGALAWRVDVRANGGYVVAAGSVRAQGIYQAERRSPVAELPAWLACALAPRPATPAPRCTPLQPDISESTARHPARCTRQSKTA